MKKYMTLVLMSTCITGSAYAEIDLGGTTSTVGTTVGVVAITYYPALMLPIATTALGIQCATTTYYGDVQGYFKCLFQEPVDFTKQALAGTSQGLGSSQNRNAVIEAAQQDLLDVVAGNDAQFPMVKDLIIHQQEVVLKANGQHISKETAAAQVYSELENIK